MIWTTKLTLYDSGFANINITPIINSRKDGRWEGRYIKSKSPSGKTQHGYVYAKTYRDAKEKLRTVFASHSQECIPPTTNIIYFSGIASEWLNSTIPQVKESTININKYRNLLQSYILPVYGKYLYPISHMILSNVSAITFYSMVGRINLDYPLKL